MSASTAQADLVGAKVYLNAKLTLDSPVIVFKREGTVIDGNNGLAEIQLTETDTATAQRVVAQIVIEQPGGTILATPPFFLDILPSTV